MLFYPGVSPLVRVKLWPMLLGWCSLAIIVIHPVCISLTSSFCCCRFYLGCRAKPPHHRVVVVCGIGLILPYFVFPAADRITCLDVIQMQLWIYRLGTLAAFPMDAQRKICIKKCKGSDGETHG